MKLINAEYNEKTGISRVIIMHKGVRYEGISKTHPEEEYISRFTGCRYAEIKAKIKALKAERRDLIAACEECRKFIKACSQCKKWDKDSSTAKVIYKQLNKKIKAVNKITNEINHLLWDLNISIKQQDSVNKKLHEPKINNPA